MARRSIAKEAELVRERLGERPVVLVGLMGAGKTSVGRRLADKLGIPFVDADHEIEAAAGKPIKEIFAEAKGGGFDTKIIRKVVRIRKQDRAKRQEEEAILDLYLAAIGEI